MNVQLLPELYGGESHPAPYVRLPPIFLGIPLSKPVVKQKEATPPPKEVTVTPETQLTWFDSAYLAALLNEVIYDVVRSEIESLAKVYVDEKNKTAALLQKIYEDFILLPEIKELINQYAWQEFHKRSKDVENLKINKARYDPSGPKLDTKAWDTLPKLEPDFVRNKPVVLSSLSRFQSVDWNQLLGPKAKPPPPPLPNSEFVSKNLQNHLAATVAGPLVVDYSTTAMEEELKALDAADRLRNPPRYL